MKLTILSLLAALPVLLVTPASAADWTTEIEGGAVRTSGNTSTQTVNGKAKIVAEYTQWRQTLKGSALNTRDNNATTGEKYDVSLKTDYKLSDRSYLFLRLGYESDRFSGYRSRVTETLGYGRDLFKTETFLWNLELGGGARQDHLTDNTRKQATIFRGSSLATWKISDSAKFSEEVSEEGGKNGWVTKSTTALQTQVYGSLSSKIYFSLTHTSQVPAGKKKLDTETGISLVYAFSTQK